MSKTILKTLVKARARILDPMYLSNKERGLGCFIKVKEKHLQVGLETDLLLYSIPESYTNDEITSIFGSFDNLSWEQEQKWFLEIYDIAIEMAAGAGV